MLNVASALRLMGSELFAQRLRFSTMTLDQCAAQVERALLEIDTAKDFLAHPELAAEALERARLRLLGAAAQIPPLETRHEIRD